MKTLPLENIRMLNLGTVWAVPHAMQLLADLGAEVIKVESIQSLDVGRGTISGSGLVGAYPDREPGRRPYNRRGVFHIWNRNNLGITLDLTRPAGVEVFKRLVRISDVVADGFPPKTMEKFGLTYAALKDVKPDIIVLSMPGYGATGPEANYLSFGVLQEQMSGLLDITGYTGDEMPMKSGIDYGDPTSGTLAAGLILSALHYRRRTGKGQFINVSQSEAVSILIGEVIMDYTMNSRLWKRMGNRDPVMAPQGCYRCRGDDRWVAISVSSDEEWRGFCNALGNPPWTKEQRFADASGRRNNHDELDRLITEWTMNHTHYEVMEIMQRAGVPAGAVLNSQERREDRHLKERGFLLEGSHPEVGTHYYQGAAMKLSRSPITIRRLGPALGEHNRLVLSRLLGYSEEEIDELERRQIIGEEPLPGADKRTG